MAPSTTDGIVNADVVRRKGIAVTIVSARACCPVEMVTAISMQSWPTNTALLLTNIYGMDTDAGRIRAVKEARAQNCKYIWFIDDDTVPPTDAGRHLMYLLEQNGPPHGKVMVAGGIYTTRSAPPEPLVYLGANEGAHWDWKVGETFKCWGIGTGCMMINLSVFDNMSEPWFLTTMTAEHKESDDLFFCTKVATANYEIMAHGGILCHHYDLERGAVYMLPRGSHPYKNRISEPHEPRFAEAALAPEIPSDAAIANAVLIDGWMSVTDLRWLAETAKGCQNIAEIGSFIGRSTRALADNAAGKVFAIDTWKGDSAIPQMMNFLIGKPADWLRNEFIKNMQGVPNVQPMQATSLEAAHIFADRGYQFDMVFIDAAHDYEAVKADITAWRPLVKPGGMLCGHDYDYGWLGVTRAVDELLPMHGTTNVNGGSIWFHKE